jgi:hypothetical protein
MKRYFFQHKKLLIASGLLFIAFVTVGIFSVDKYFENKYQISTSVKDEGTGLNSENTNSVQSQQPVVTNQVIESPDINQQTSSDNTTVNNPTQTPPSNSEAEKYLARSVELQNEIDEMNRCSNIFKPANDAFTQKRDSITSEYRYERDKIFNDQSLSLNEGNYYVNLLIDEHNSLQKQNYESYLSKVGYANCGENCNLIPEPTYIYLKHY